MTNWLIKRAIPLCLAILASCNGTEPSAPAEIPLRLIAGEYELTGGGETTSPEWGRESIHIEGILRIVQDPVTRSKLSGTLTDFRFAESWVADDRTFDGVVVGSINANGVLLLELDLPSEGSTWTARGTVVGSQISGQWQMGGWVRGGFTAQLKPTP